MISKFTLIIALLLLVHLNEYDVKAAKIIESSKIEKKLSKTASVLLASKEQKENDVPRSDDKDEKRSQTHKGYHTIKKSIGDLSLELAKVHILEATIKKRRGITNLKNKVNVNSEDNCKRIKKVGEPIVHHHSGLRSGAWMRDPLRLLGANKIWYINGHIGNKVLEFQTMDHFKAGVVSKTYTMPYNIYGTGSVVYGRYLYFHREGTCKVIQYDLVEEQVKKEKCPSTHIKSGNYSYQWGGNTGVDLSVDESGLWVIWAYEAFNGHLCATLVDTLTLSPVYGYCGSSSESKDKMGNAFVACGIVYSIDDCYKTSTTINYAYDTGKKSGSNPNIKFTNKFGYNIMVTYNPREKVLYAWDRYRQITYPLEFEE